MLAFIEHLVTDNDHFSTGSMFRIVAEAGVELVFKMLARPIINRNLLAVVDPIIHILTLIIKVHILIRNLPIVSYSNAHWRILLLSGILHRSLHLCPHFTFLQPYTLLFQTELNASALHTNRRWVALVVK